MSIATITSKGQVTIPKDVRVKLHLEAGEKIAFRVDETAGQAVLTPMNKTVDEVFGILGAVNRQKRRSVEQMNAAVSKHFRRRFR